MLMSILLIFALLSATATLASCAWISSSDAPTAEGITSLPVPSDAGLAPPDSTPLPDSDTDAASDTVATTENQTVPRDPAKKLRILFVGNSFTYYNGMPLSMFLQIAKAAGYDVIVESLTEGGHYLCEFASPNDAKGKLLADKLSSSVKYDIVIIQEQSACPIANPALFYDGVRQLSGMIAANGAEMWLYATWGYKKGHSDLSKYGQSTTDMEMKLRAAYLAIDKELNANISHVGVAFGYFDARETGVNLYHTDLKHPSANGSMLAAWTLFASIFKVDPRTVNYNGDIGADVSDTMKTVAYLAAFGNVDVSDEYRTVSEGVTAPKSDASSNIDISKTVNLTEFPSSGIISHVIRDSNATGNGWQAVKGSTTQTFSGIRGDKDKISSSEYNASGLTDTQKADIADIGYGVSVIGIDHMNSTKKGYETAVANLCNGHWGSSFMATMVFDDKKYDINGKASETGDYAALITLNFGEVFNFDAIGYFSGSMYGFAQAQEVFVSDDGITWEKVDSACYNTIKMHAADQTLKQIASPKLNDPWNNNSASVQVLFSMAGSSGKYIRIGLVAGGELTSTSVMLIDINGIQEINTRELVVFGTKK